MIAFAIAVIVVFLFGSLVVGMIWLEPHSVTECADASVADNKPVWWQHAVIDAKARKEKLGPLSEAEVQH